MTHRIRTIIAALAVLGLSILLLSSTSTSASADPSDPDATPREVAEEILAEVQELVAPPAQGQRDPHPPGTDDGDVDVTLELRDLAVHLGDLSKTDQRVAKRLLARPTEPGSDDCVAPLGCYTTSERANLKKTCVTGVVCVHYSQVAGPNRVPTEDNGIGGTWPVGTASGNGVPDYAEATLATLAKVIATYETAGYRKPPADGNREDTAEFDVYLADLDTAYGQLYGYCSTDGAITGHGAYASYCALDNDFSPGQFGTSQTPLGNLWVTTAHEYFHAVQFAYDAAEDGWLAEATATWAEDEVFPTINDNVQYLPYGSLGNPSYALDQFNDFEAYGNWIFFRYLAQRYPTKSGGMPVIIREIWERTTQPNSSSNTAGAMYSIESIKVALAVRGSSLPAELSWFAQVNRVAPVYYADGARFPVAPLRGQATLTKAKPVQNPTVRLDHLSTATYRYGRSSTLTGAGWKFRLDVNLPPSVLGSVARITIKRTGQALVSGNLTLNANGDGNVTHFFNNDVEWVEVTVVNGSTRYGACAYGEDPPGDGTCGGYPLDDGLASVIKVSALR